MESRDYYIEPRADEQTKLDLFLSNIEQHYDIEVHETASVEIPVLEGSVIYHYCLIKLPDGRKLDGKPTMKGVYVIDGRKIVIN